MGRRHVCDLHGLVASSEGGSGGAPCRQALVSRLFTPRPVPSVCAVAYIAGICLLVGVATCLIVAALVLRRKDRMHLRALAAAREEAAATAAETAAAAAAHRAANPFVIPVVIVQPDGEVSLAEKCGKGWDAEAADLEQGGGKGDIKAQQQQPPPHPQPRQPPPGGPGSRAQQ